MKPQPRNPLHGTPCTTVTTTHNGTPRFRIVPRVLTPFRVKVADTVSWILEVTLFLVCCYVFVYALQVRGWEEALTLLALFLAARFVLRHVLLQALRVKTEIVMTGDEIKVRRWFFWRRYDRLIEHRFALQWHDRAEAEGRHQAHASRQAASRGNVIKQEPRYAASLHVVLVYAGQRVDLLTVFGQKEAAAIVARLQYCDRALNEALAMTGGIRQTPADDWADAPGGMRHD